MKIATWNVNSVTARLSLLVRWLDEAQPDVVCLQETKTTNERFPTQTLEELGYSCALFGQRTYNGVAILAKRSLGEIENVRRGFSGEGIEAQARLIAATVAGVRVVNVYVPNGQAVGTEKFDYKLTWLKRLRAYFDAQFKTDEHVLLCGDFNIAPEDRDVYNPNFWRGKILFSDEEHEALANLRAWGFVDSFRQHEEAGGFFTWWDYRAMSFRRNAGLRIDHIWTSPALAEHSTRCWIDAAVRGWERPSDHAPVVGAFQL